jgi:hypothetical protein
LGNFVLRSTPAAAAAVIFAVNSESTSDFGPEGASSLWRCCTNVPRFFIIAFVTVAFVIFTATEAYSIAVSSCVNVMGERQHESEVVRFGHTVAWHHLPSLGWALPFQPRNDGPRHARSHSAIVVAAATAATTVAATASIVGYGAPRPPGRMVPDRKRCGFEVGAAIPSSAFSAGPELRHHSSLSRR